ncbi:hypothetical protein M569_15248 [Genlisea aurea]|uniref:Exocyst subunit Exo70 family protein n=1 Tax=Genlisea aurea TaxID=192259 RepID=S8DJ92_9LAMI|nr:hypothetical protein M569_15248 [Genlisea aurea]
MKGICLLRGRVSSPPHHPRAPPQSPVLHRNTNRSETVTAEEIDSAESVILKWQLDAHKHEKFSSLFAGGREDAKRFLHAVSSLHTAMRVCLKQKSSSDELHRCQKLMQIAIKRLEKEFYVTLSANRKKLDSESVSLSLSNRSSLATPGSSDSDSIEDEITAEEIGVKTPKSGPESVAMEDLRSIAECMIECGYGSECVKIYKLLRKSIVDEAMHFLEIERTSPSEMQQMEWNVLDAKIKTWLRAMKTAIGILFHGEKILCDAVFASSETLAASCFADICRDAAVDMFSFAGNFGKSRKILTPEKLFRALDLYQAITDSWPEIESIFWHESSSPVKAEAGAALGKLGEAAKLMIAQFETAIQKDSSKTPPGGGVHPLTRYVMNFLTFLGDYSGSVSEILADWPLNKDINLPASFFSSSPSAVDPSAAVITACLAWFILVLLCKLDGKGTLYKNAALSYLFLGNNLNYVVSKVKGSNLRLLLGPDWIRKNRIKANRYLSSYERMGWTKVISTLPDDPTAEIPPHQAVEHFKQFNRCFEEARKTQVSWVIPDIEARDRVRSSLGKEIVCFYRIFYQKQRIDDEKTVRYTPDELEIYFSHELFNTASSGRGG